MLKSISLFMLQHPATTFWGFFWLGCLAIYLRQPV